MSELLATKNEAQFILHKSFQASYLAAVGQFVQWKLANDWDDYNELFHATKLVQQIAQTEGVWLHTHSLVKGNKNIGVCIKDKDNSQHFIFG